MIVMNIVYIALVALNLCLVSWLNLFIKRRRKENISKFNEDNGLARFDFKEQIWVCTTMPIGYCDEYGNILLMSEELVKVAKENASNKRITSEQIPVFSKGT